MWESSKVYNYFCLKMSCFLLKLNSVKIWIEFFKRIFRHYSFKNSCTNLKRLRVGYASSVYDVLLNVTANEIFKT